MSDRAFKVVVADDDEPTRSLLKTMLETFERVTVVGMADSGRGLLKLVEDTAPEVIFVDVQMPDLDGLSAVFRLQKEHPDVFAVFISAHAHYAAEAFDLDAVDYVVKPLNRDRVGRALAKARRFVELRSIVAAADFTLNGPDNTKRLVLKCGHGATVVKTDDIFFIEKMGKRCIIHTDGSRYDTVDRLSSIERQLDARFFRCHKSFIININRVERVIPYADRAYEISFRGYPYKVTMRRDRFEDFCRLVKNEKNA
ncbi:MAG: LytTR family DNA-binding domain-containing protein [Bacillota bacterium]